MPSPAAHSLRAAAAALALAAAAAPGTSAPALAGGIERVSLGPGGAQGDDFSAYPVLSADGRFVAFHALAGNLVPGDTNRALDVFVRDRRTGRTERVSVGPGGAQADGRSSRPKISADGRFVAFESEAANLVPGDTNGDQDVFVHDRRTRETRRANVGPGGVQADRGNSSTHDLEISADGRFVAFSSIATNLVPGDTNRRQDVFVHDLETGKTRRVSVGPRGAQADGGSGAASISGDGRLVAFGSSATNLVRGDTNGEFDIFVHDLATGRTRRVVAEAGNPALSADGRVLAFVSSAADLVPGDTNGEGDVFVRELRSGATRRANVGPGGTQAEGETAGSFDPVLSADGRFVAFWSDAANLVAGDTNGQPDVFVHDRRTGSTRRASVGPGGVQGDGFSEGPALSADGRHVAFTSGATNLVPGDTNDTGDAFVRTR